MYPIEYRLGLWKNDVYDALMEILWGYKIYIPNVKRYKKFMKCFFLRTKYDIIKTIQIGE